MRLIYIFAISKTLRRFVFWPMIFCLLLALYWHQFPDPRYKDADGGWVMIACFFGFFWLPAAFWALIGRIVARDWRNTPVGETFREQPRRRK